MTTTIRTDRLRSEMVALADCMDCAWTYEYTGEAQDVGAATLAAGRTHAARHGHLVLVHRSTSYDGRPM